MFAGKLVFSQVMDFMPLHTFRRCVAKYQGDYKVRRFSCLDQYLCMAFAQLTYRESLRDIEVCLRSQKNKLLQVDQAESQDQNLLRDIRKCGEVTNLDRRFGICSRGYH